MDYPWSIAAAAMIMIGIALIIYALVRRPQPAKINWIAYSAHYAKGPRFRALVASLRRTVIIQGATVCALILVISLMAGGPVTSHTHRQSDISRDIVLCLDVSGSMLNTDRKVTQSFREIIEHFEGERVALHVWNSTDATVFPLTDDYDMALFELRKLENLLKQADVDNFGSALVSDELYDFLELTMPMGAEGTSLVADGVASCVLAFPQAPNGRSRTMIVATDNEPQGSSVYTLDQATDLAKQRHVKIFGLYSHDSSLYGMPDFYSESEAQKQKTELAQSVKKTGGKIFDVSDAQGIQTILEDIDRQTSNKQKKGRLITTVSDNNLVYAVVLMTLLSILFISAGVSRR
ncbi:MAG: VWA domain-containing protein [Actinomycetaceae bacterium]|nr:VWA domain-containing protein [Actinomycetaceae bacterium]